MLEFSKILTHQKTGKEPAKKSPHLPLDFKPFKVEVLFFVFLKKIQSTIIIKYKDVKKKNKDHHQYCQTSKWTTLALLTSKKDALNDFFDLSNNSIELNMSEV
jgi:hypothetical protein